MNCSDLCYSDCSAHDTYTKQMRRALWSRHQDEWYKKTACTILEFYLYLQTVRHFFIVLSSPLHCRDLQFHQAPFPCKNQSVILKHSLNRTYLCLSLLQVLNKTLKRGVLHLVIFLSDFQHTPPHAPTLSFCRNNVAALFDCYPSPPMIFFSIFCSSCLNRCRPPPADPRPLGSAIRSSTMRQQSTTLMLRVQPSQFLPASDIKRHDVYHFLGKICSLLSNFSYEWRYERGSSMTVFTSHLLHI